MEQSCGALLFTLSKYGNLVLYPIHPATASDFRKAVYPSGNKSDPVDADVLLDFLLTHRGRLRSGGPILSRLVSCNSWWKIAVVW